MLHYTKGRNEEEAWDKDKVPIDNLPENFVWMQVSAGSKIRNLLEVAWREFEEKPYILWSASGQGVNKAITCAEITKRKFAGLQQTTKICYRETKEYWDPKMEDMDQLVVRRRTPAIHILLSKNNCWKKTEVKVRILLILLFITSVLYFNVPFLLQGSIL